MMTIKNKIIALAAVSVLAASAGAAAALAPREAVSTNPRVVERIRKELVTLPYYGVFDYLAFKFNGDTVTLYGYVTRPTTRDDAARRVARIEGIERVINKIQVLPLSSLDDSIRIRTYRTVFGTSGLYRYALGANPSIHIIVNHGHMTLEGVVANEMDKQLAYMAASSVPDVFSVSNNLRVEGKAAELSYRPTLRQRSARR